jgi:DNA-binding transcriptional ArsR family regulator
MMGVKHAELKPGRNPVKDRLRLPEEAPTYPLTQRIRQEALLILHEGEFSAADIAEMIGEETSHVTNHLRDLYDAGCIEFVGHLGKGNFKKAVYRAITRPFTSHEEFMEMSLEERQESIGVLFQWIVVEATASYRSKKMASDDNCVVMFDEPCLDAEGRVELDEFFNACWGGDFEVLEKLKSVQDIAARAANRMAKSGETGVIVVASLMAFERARSRITKGSSRVPVSKKE